MQRVILKTHFKYEQLAMRSRKNVRKFSKNVLFYHHVQVGLRERRINESYVFGFMYEIKPLLRLKRVRLQTSYCERPNTIGENVHFYACWSSKNIYEG